METETENIKTLLENIAWDKCPICQNSIKQSEYLETAIDNEKTRYFANLVTHYRHHHITSWNKCWSYGGHRYRANWFGDYDDEKAKVNERAKRQIIRKGFKILKEMGITSEHIAELENTTEETMKIARKYL